MPSPLPEPPLPTREFPEVREFLGGFYNKDYGPDHEAIIRAIVRAYVSDTKPEYVALLRAELDVLFTLELDEDQTRALVVHYGCAYRPWADGLTASEWLRSMRDQLG